MSLKAKNRHIKHTEEWNRNISKSHKNVKLSEAHKESLRKHHVGMTGKKMPGFHWYNNGIINVRTRGDCPEGFVLGRLKLKNENKGNAGKHGYNNGIRNVFAKECPEGYVPGILRKKKKN